jgi:hypothetical protein
MSDFIKHRCRVLTATLLTIGFCSICSVSAVTIYEATPAFDNLIMSPPLSSGPTNALGLSIFGSYPAPYFAPAVVLSLQGNDPLGNPIYTSSTTNVLGTPNDGKYFLADSSFGQTFAGLHPDFDFGDIITPFPGADTNQAPGIIPASSAFYVPSRQIVIAADIGAVQITWKMLSGPSVTRVYLISAVPKSRPARIFWTEPPYNAPVIDLSKQHVLVHYNNSIPNAPNVDLNSVGGVSFIKTNSAPLNTVWVDSPGGLHAQGVSGRFILEYFKTGNNKEQIGYEIVEALEPEISTLSASIGSRLLPISTAYGQEDLIPDIRNGFPDFVYWHQPNDGGGHFFNWVYAIRSTLDDPSQIHIYWKHTGIQHVQWPFEVDWYSVGWPDDRFTQHFVRNGLDPAGAVSFPTNLTVELERFQEPQHATLVMDSPNRFYTTGEGRSLLRYSSGDDVWFEVVRAIDSTNSHYFNRTSIPWQIGQELQPIAMPSTLGFDGVSSWLALPVLPGPPGLAQNMTIEAWVRPAKSANMNIFNLTDSSTHFQSDHGLALDANGKFWHHGSQTDPAKGNKSSISAVPGRWYHVAVEADTEGNIRFYLNGVQQGSDVSNSINVPLLSVYAFGISDQQFGFDNFQGEMKEVMIWNQIRTAPDILNDMYRPLTGSEPGLARYITGEDQQVDQNGDAQIWDLAEQVWQAWSGDIVSPAAAPMPLSMLPGFDGKTTDLTFAPYIDGSGNAVDFYGATIELWLKPSNTTNAVIFTLSQASNGVYQVFQEMGFDSEGHVFHRAKRNSSSDSTITSATQFVPNRWYHLAAQHDSVGGAGKMRLFVNGVEEGVEASVSSAPIDNLATLRYHFGMPMTQDGLLPYHGEMRDVRLWNTSISQTQIAGDMNRDVGPQESGLIHAFDLRRMSIQADGSRTVPDLLYGQTADWNGTVAESSTPLEIPATDAGAIGFIDQSAGTRYNPNFYSWPQTNSHVFGVNEGALEVWWTQIHQQDFMPVGISWPSFVQRYTNVWPLTSPELVIAGQSTDRTGLLPAIWENAALYYQNDQAQPGFNPNEEHAMLVSGQVYALRDDLNTDSQGSSQPYVLVQYNDLENGGRPAMQAFHVVETNQFYQFATTVTVGTLIQPPMPLSLLPSSGLTYFETEPGWQAAWKDRNSNNWSFAAGADGSPVNPAPVNSGMHFYYPLQEGFYFPGLSPQPELGVEVPWLSRQGLAGHPMLFIYTNVWPSSVPVLAVGETLVSQKHGLPAIAGQKSVLILYEQSGDPAVQLIDPTRDQTVPLATVPPDAVTSISGGKIYFTQLPPHLRSRLFYDPTLQVLTFRGDYVVPPAGESYLLLNYLSGDNNMATSDRYTVRNLSSDSTWHAAIDNLAANLVSIGSDTNAFDSLALVPTGSQGTGYITLAFNSSSTLAQPSDPISLEVIRVDTPLYKGQVEPIFSDNPLDEKLTMRFSGDFGGHAEKYEFDWRYLPPDASGNPDKQPRENWTSFTSGPKSNQLSVVIQGPGKVTLSDNYFVVRYRPLPDPSGTNWSNWTDPALAEGWIKRALDGINPFEQRISDLENTRVNTTVSLISQAGARWVGDIPLNLDNINDYGLIEIYETILKRGISLSIDSGTGSYDAANDALLLAAGRIHDLYMTLGNDAYADSLDPTIAYGTTDKWIYGSEGSSIFCFEGQVATLLDEELALLYGRDDSLQPSVQIYPVYNRLYWNFTKGLNGGEAAYALNYNVPNADGDVNGTIDESDAKKLYPQGHGDAWGHYLSAISTYYQLLSNTNFTWSPRIEAKIIGGVTVSVDYFDERKFAEAAAAKARAGAAIVSLVHRKLYNESQVGLWNGFRDSNTNRAWGLGEWASRAGQGAYFDWAVANSLLPDVDPEPTDQGIQKIDRTTVPELQEIVAQIDAVQLEADHADRRLNPLGLARNAVPFDIDPKQIDAGKTHFEQIYDRATVALNNANQVLLHAQNAVQVLRRQDDSLQDFTTAVEQSEQDFNNQLVALLGYPYSDDIGPGKLYPQGYSGPDLFHFQYVDLQDVFGAGSPETPIIITNKIVTSDNNFISPHEYSGGTLSSNSGVTNYLITNVVVGAGIPAKPASYTGFRHAEGEVQAAYGDYVRTWDDLRLALDNWYGLEQEISDNFDRLKARGADLDSQNTLELDTTLGSTAATVLQKGADLLSSTLKDGKEFAILTSTLTAAGLPTSAIFGVADGGDTFFAPRTVILGQQLGFTITASVAKKIAEAGKIASEIAQKVVEGNLKGQVRNWDFANEMQGLVLELSNLLDQQSGMALTVQQRAQVMFQAREHYRTILANAERVLAERTTFRANAATRIQQDRYLDSAFQVFRSESLGQYRAAEDLAARYAYLAAKAYDYETGLLSGAQPGAQDSFVSQIVRTRSLGLIQDSQPQLGGTAGGDPGLADVLAKMKANWSVLKGRFGFNNPSTETSRFSLRSELLRIASPVDAAGLKQADDSWRSARGCYKVDNLLALPEFNRYCVPFNPVRAAEPALVIPFSTTVQAGENFFGWPLAGGDNAYDSSHFATKIRSVGIWFSNFNNNFGAGLANQPRVYLVPVGNDLQRSSANQQPLMWQVVDQALPLPFEIGSSGVLDKPDWTPIIDSLAGGFGAIRQFASLRAYHDSGQFDAGEVTTNSRLIGRSVWNTRWLLIIPGSTLLADPDRGLEIFINGLEGDGNGIKDIKLFFQTYSYSGN